MPSDVEVPHLVRAADEGDQQAWDRLVERFAPLVWAVARGHGLGVAAAEDVAQTTWLRLVESLGTVSSESLGAWLARATRVEALNALRWADPRVEVRARRSDEHPLAAALKELPARSRLALRLLTVPEITRPELSAGLGLGVAEADALVGQSLDRLVVALKGILVREAPQ